MRSYRELGHDVDVFVLAHSSSRVIVGDGVRVYIVRRQRSALLKAATLFRRDRQSLLEAMRAAGDDVLHAHWGYEFAAAALDYRPSSLVTYHDSPSLISSQYSGYYWKRRALLGGSVLSRIERATAVSPSLGAAVKATRPDISVSVIPNGVIPSFNPPHNQHSRYTFATIANGFDDRKNTAAALRAFSLIRDRCDANLVMFGSGHGEGDVAEAWAIREGLAEGVQFAGPTDHETLLAYLRSDVDVLLHTSRWEACSLAVLEAMNSAVLVVGGAESGDMPWMLGDAGALVDVDDAPSIAAAALRLANADRRPLLLKGVSARIRDRFSHATSVNAYLGLLSSNGGVPHPVDA